MLATFTFICTASAASLCLRTEPEPKTIELRRQRNERNKNNNTFYALVTISKYKMLDAIQIGCETTISRGRTHWKPQAKRTQWRNKRSYAVMHHNWYFFSLVPTSTRCVSNYLLNASTKKLDRWQAIPILLKQSLLFSISIFECPMSLFRWVRVRVCVFE